MIFGLFSSHPETWKAEGRPLDELPLIWRSHSPVGRRSLTLCTWFLLAGGAANAGMTLEIRVEIRSEFVKTTVINPSFQFVYRLAG